MTALGYDFLCTQVERYGKSRFCETLMHIIFMLCETLVYKGLYEYEICCRCFLLLHSGCGSQ